MLAVSTVPPMAVGSPSASLKRKFNHANTSQSLMALVGGERSTTFAHWVNALPQQVVVNAGAK